MNGRRQGIEMRRYAIVNAVLAAAAALVLALHDDPAAPAPLGATPHAPAARADAQAVIQSARLQPPLRALGEPRRLAVPQSAPLARVRRSIRLLLKNWSTS
ncbi:hypothetical protein ACFPQ5_21270 [Massilia suwonensis]|uniref:Uncharacterized protein n=2 Tax=Massilia suwonensis TaxID=648895 RepID=A0ABW0MUS3_9BURK